MMLVTIDKVAFDDATRDGYRADDDDDDDDDNGEYCINIYLLNRNRVLSICVCHKKETVFLSLLN